MPGIRSFGTGVHLNRNIHVLDLYRLHQEKLDLVVKFLEVNIEMPVEKFFQTWYNVAISIHGGR